MFKIDSDKNIEVTRGDSLTIKLTNKNGNFNIGDKLKLSIVEKKNYNNVILQKEYKVLEKSNSVFLELTSEETRIGDVISKKQEFWYEIEYNGNQTLIGYDEDGAKKFTIYPEAPQKEGNL